MSDPVGLISGMGGTNPVNRGQLGNASTQNAGPNFRDVLLDNLREVNDARREADSAVEDLMTGQRDDVEGVMLATQKADNAFKMLQAVRGKVIAAYDEIRQVRV